ncbi:N-acetyl-gamma-glutamyl-phosphate reductase [Colwellia psychrerythraea]|uniref:N-acetyl-gamma-glutamyl-phosphate reductase n=1 Tax=Colwellia psychrerythraea TaxID=28229 RepID=A0A099KFV5_COLPS|nr:N-acetyl-gamma-glutamyl-phosphate reductase [Colwellia psychrerythraea]KGJ88498.1 N-acetyl-gamma-glutamyl-phosphate reductase [Colwellia psychrerythraea]
MTKAILDSNNSVQKVAIIGASGYAGAELVGLLCKHEQAQISHLVVSENSSSEGKLFSELHGRYQGVCDLPLEAFSATWFDEYAADLDVVFFATPHEFSADWAQAFVEAGVKVFDLSGGFRLKDADDYPKYYGFEHANIDALASAKYGLAEWQQDDITSTNLVAVPGCYPTASLLCLKPLTYNNLVVENSLVVVNGISGVSGAGRNASLATNFNEVSLKAYNVLQHRHQPEISQEAAINVIFNPHLAPYKRGLLATVTLQLNAGVTNAQVEQVFQQAYADKPLVRLVASWPEIGNVAHTPFADVHWQFDEEKQVVVVSCAIDNLLKGAASQAVQCFNISLGLASEYSLISAC